jgi:hypothetical protein
MRVTIVSEDGLVSIDGVGFGGLDLSFIDSSVHAVQWYGEIGEIERKDPITKRMVSNDAITSLSAFQTALDAWAVADAAEKLAVAEAKKNAPTPSSGEMPQSVL